MANWGAWASTSDDRKEQVLKSLSAAAILQVRGWQHWANTDTRKELVLKTKSFAAIVAVSGWSNWVRNNDSRKELLLHTQCALAIEQVEEWGSWASTQKRRDLVMSSGCNHAINQLASTANNLRANSYSGSTSSDSEEEFHSPDNTRRARTTINSQRVFRPAVSTSQVSGNVRDRVNAGFDARLSQGANKYRRFK